MKKRYYSAIALVAAPFVSWNSIGDFTTEEFLDSEYVDDPLVVSESELPGYSFGVCNQKIEAGVLVDRTPMELAEFETAFDIREKFQENKNKITAVENGSFTHNDIVFPLDAASRLYYLSIDNQQNVRNIRAVDGSSYTLEIADIPDFIDNMWKQIQALTAHTF